MKENLFNNTTDGQTLHSRKALFFTESPTAYTGPQHLRCKKCRQ